MEELNLIKKLEALREVKPNKEWASFIERDIISKEFEREESAFSIFVANTSRIFETPKVLAPVLVSSIVAVFAFALFSSQNTMPGDNLYSLKKAYNEVATIFLPEESQAIARIKQADTLLMQLDKMSKAGENTRSNMEAGMEEVKKAISIASREITKAPENQQADLVSQLVSKVSGLEETTNASIMDSESGEIIYSAFLKNEIKELESNKDNLIEEHLILLNTAKEKFAIGDYMSALEAIYNIQPKIEEETIEETEE